MSDSIYYLAYGSNLHPGRLGARLGEVKLVGICPLHRWRLVFNKRGEDDSAKANITHTGRAGDLVWCVLYRLRADVMPELDKYETRGYGYDRVEFRIDPQYIRPESDDAVTAQSYISPPGWQQEDWLPYDWYLELIRLGARYHGFPECYRRMLSRQTSMPDPDVERSNKSSRLLTGIAERQLASPDNFDRVEGNKNQTLYPNRSCFLSKHKLRFLNSEQPGTDSDRPTPPACPGG